LGTGRIRKRQQQASKHTRQPHKQTNKPAHIPDSGWNLSGLYRKNAAHVATLVLAAEKFATMVLAAAHH
jgi:hypothetical protein